MTTTILTTRTAHLPGNLPGVLGHVIDKAVTDLTKFAAENNIVLNSKPRGRIHIDHGPDSGSSVTTYKVEIRGLLLA